MLFALYVIGVPLFGSLAWAFSDAAYLGRTDDRHFRRPLSVVAGMMWPLMMVGMAQLLAVCLLASLGRRRRPAMAGVTR